MNTLKLEEAKYYKFHRLFSKIAADDLFAFGIELYIKQHGYHFDWGQDHNVTCNQSDYKLQFKMSGYNEDVIVTYDYEGNVIISDYEIDFNKCQFYDVKFDGSKFQYELID
ncbi:hypothetical protein QFZ28_000173 [Neobacillus niacini]|uniref:hypothetical protein n=1 Tax=Neobacillus niacini TaxID=86668 RepID=UPI00278B8D65|nr:hypothetical protein [Neobacillus niacini]MDQ0999773.1 hypothetical protein [Neobacillus niacini]